MGGAADEHINTLRLCRTSPSSKLLKYYVILTVEVFPPLSTFDGRSLNFQGPCHTHSRRCEARPPSTVADPRVLASTRQIHLSNHTRLKQQHRVDMVMVMMKLATTLVLSLGALLAQYRAVLGTSETVFSIEETVDNQYVASVQLFATGEPRPNDYWALE